MALVEKFLCEAESLKAQAAIESLNPAENAKTEFEFGRGCGIQEGIGLAIEFLNKLITETEKDATNAKNRRTG